MNCKNFFIALFSLLILSCNGQKNDAYENITAAAFSEKIKTTPTAQIIDVRTPEEYASQHIDNAKNINWNESDFESKASELDKKQPVFVYCMVGGRSKKASDKLVEMGFSKVYDLQGGIMKWNAAGFSKPSGKIIGMCSQEYGDLLKSKPKIMINFYANWCEPCVKMKPYITQMQTDLKDQITIVRLNADENKTLIADLKLDGLPVILIYENAELKWKHIGFISEEDLKKQLQ
ncbi:MAG: thioredoxin [Flavobacterium sp.]|nr:thioredoxin [Flavobacterium sp.]